MTARPQRGAVLLIALIFLVVLTLLGLGAFNAATIDLKIAGNMQMRNEALNAAQDAVETAISTPQFTIDPANAVLAPCGAPNTLCADYSGDGTADYVTRLEPAPACVSKKAIRVSELDLSKPNDLGCLAGQAQQFGIEGGLDARSLCGTALWEITAQTSSPATGAKVTVSQGVGLRIGRDALEGSCS
ncbi:MAG TPA: PilX N-terminal domain-containing pilus assembly protein [Burkholderiales bacterium]|nr:PilX N-terminal domain-containing pilus assembly protein [Burkholderiales bacterium]